MRTFLGELVGTLILVFIGCGSVGVSLFVPWFDLLEIALCWGLAVFAGIMVSSTWCGAHLNPAVSLAFLLGRKMPLAEFLKSVAGQCAGALAAAVLLWLAFNGSLAELESAKGWSRSSEQVLSTARMFGEYYNTVTTSTLEAFMVELIGTAVLVFMVFVFSRSKDYAGWLVASFVGLTVTVIILFLAPVTQCGINPARDIFPRLVSYLGGYRSAFSLPQFGALVVYVVGPIVGAILAVIVWKIALFANVSKYRNRKRLT